ncbi:hypothetical protein NX059_006361 [Plenodomus lindquistii]|nr:hypothetical protein NX059_006361 [Plenodomus lindquistii]
MISPEGQRAVLKVWASDTDMVVGPKEQPEAAFARLAGVKGWADGDANWCEYWKSCFGKDYHHPGQAQTTTIETATATSDTMEDKESTPAPDLVDRMRRLSVSSHTSSFSIVSVASSCPSVQSLDSRGSIVGGVKVASSSEFNSNVVAEEEEARQQDPPIVTPSPRSPAPKLNVEAATGDKDKAESKPTAAAACPFWYSFGNFKPSPTAKFKDEFNRLAQHQKWSKTQRRKFQLSALRAEIAFHNGTCIQKLAKWQNLCEEMGVEKGLPSIKQCKTALKKVYVNLWNVIDHRRNPEIPIKHFKSRAQFCKAIRAGNRFPREIAKQDGFVNVLLRTI